MLLIAHYKHNFQGLAAFLKAIGFLIPLMDAEYASYYTREVMLILIREFASPDEEMKKIVLKVGNIFSRLLIYLNDLLIVCVSKPGVNSLLNR